MNQKTPTVPEHVTPAPTHGGEPPRPPVGPKRNSGKGWVWLVLLLGAAAATYYYWPKGTGAEAGTVPGKSEKGGKKRGGGTAPVVVVKAAKGNIGVYINATASIVPIYTVTVKSRVDGQLMQVYYKEGDLVQKGQPLIDLDSRPYEVSLEQAEGQLARDTALLNNARVDLARYQTLLAQNAIPEQQLATQRATVAQLEGTTKIDQGAINAAKLNIAYCHIAAPITGKIGLRLVDPGNIVHASDQTGLMVITQIEPISAIFPVAEDQLPPVARRFRAGQKLTVEAWDHDQKNKLAVGTLTTMDNQIDPSTGSLKLRATFDNKDDALFPNQFVNTRLLVEMKRGVVLLPTAAIQLTVATKYVWVLRPDSTVTVRNVTVGTTEGEHTEVTSGLEAGENVIMTGVDKLSEGAKVTVGAGEGAGGRGGGRGRGAGNGAPSDASGDVPAANGPGAESNQPAAGGPGGQGRRGGKSGGRHQ
jgi:membrane fusion protein, multidrug efflux system